MTTQLYLVPLPDAQATQPPSQGVSSRVAIAGLLEEGGISTENIATQDVDLQIRGQFRLGEFSHKLKRELESLGESTYTAVPLYDEDKTNLGDDRGYYELASVDVNPAHKSTRQAYEYTVGLKKKGTRESEWTAVKTNSEDIGTGLATGSTGLIGVPSDDLKERWYSTASGSEVATPTQTVSAEFGDVDLFDPTESSFDDPTLVFEQPYSAEGNVDVRVWDDLGEDKFASLSDGDGGTVEVTQWVHAFHTGFEFDGAPIVDNGLLRLRFDESAGTVEAWEWDEGSSAWTSIALTLGDWALFDADLESLGPASVEAYLEFEDTTDGSLSACRLSVQRGLDRAVVRNPQNDTIPSGLETALSPLASDQTTDQQPSQTLLPRGDLK